ncbi:hypothetical protein GKQ38_02865 [Candidatus Nanohaloarchaea archaeon]|nr:hypothetical protein GKQ38_02865 [Candidatus Nanohaloarchaea archaeon]
MAKPAGKEKQLPRNINSADSVPVDDIDFRSGEKDKSVEELLDEHKRLGVRPFTAEVQEFERLDEGRRSDILNSIDQSVDLETDEWMEPDYENADIEVDWEKLKEASDEERRFEKLEEKYTGPAGLFQLSVQPDDDIEWQPGDFFSIKLPETPGLDLQGHQVPEVRRETAEDETVFRAYSIGSSPNDDAIDFYIKRIPDEAVTEQSLTPVLDAKMKEADEITLRGPYSDELSIKETSEKDMVYVSTGTGMAPLKSMIDFSLEEGLDSFEGEERDMYILLGASYEDELPAHQHFQELDEENENIHYIPTVSRESLVSDWDGETDYVQNVLSDYAGDEIDMENAEVYVCGMSTMAQGVRQTVEELGLDTENGSYHEEVFD